MSDLESAKRTAVALGLDEPDDGALLAREYGMHGQPAAVPERDLAIIEGEILFYKRQAGSSIIEIGKRLNEAKAQLSHGEWLPWLREKVDISERSAQVFMRLAREYSESAEIADLGASKALALLALPVSEREDFAAEKHTVNGVEKTVAEMTGKELKEAIRQRDEARRAAEEAEANRAVAEAARAKMETDMAQVKAMLKSARDEEAAWVEKLAKAKNEILELKNRPVEVAVETKDAAPEQLAKAREEGQKAAEQQKKAEIAAKEEQVKKLKEELRRAREEAKAASANLQQAEKEARAAKEAAERAGRMARISESRAVAEFGILFDQVKETVNRMAAAMAAETGENQTKMRTAMTALADAIREAANA